MRCFAASAGFRSLPGVAHRAEWSCAHCYRTSVLLLLLLLTQPVSLSPPWGVCRLPAGSLCAGELEHLAAGRAELVPFDPNVPLPRMSYKDGYQRRYFVLDSFQAGLAQLRRHASGASAR